MKAYKKRIYLSATWDGNLRAETVQVADWIAQHDVTVVRDHQENKNGDPLKETRTWVHRVNYMLRDCCGLVVVLPFNSRSPQTTSPYLIPELLVADAQGIPILLFANPSVEAKPQMVNGEVLIHFPKPADGPVLRAKDVMQFRPDQNAEMDGLLNAAGGFALTNPGTLKGPYLYPNANDKHAVVGAIQDFVEACTVREPYPFVFNVLPFSLKDSTHQTIASEVFKATGMACHISLDFITGETSTRRNWEMMLSRSDLVIAELSSLRDSCLFESGCAIGLGKHVFVLSKKGQKALPFGLDDQRFHQYKSAAELAQFVRETCCKAHRREVFNLSPEFKAQHLNTLPLPGVPAWLDQTVKVSLDTRLTLSILGLSLSAALAIQIVALILWPASPKPTVLAVLSLIPGLLGFSRVGREFWEQKVGRWLSWLPFVAAGAAVVLAVSLAVLVVRGTQGPTSQSALSPATNTTPPKGLTPPWTNSAP